MKRRVVGIMLLALASCSGVENEAAARKREAREIEKRLGSTKITLYRVLKTALRSLPPRAHVRRVVEGRQELSREEWAALIEKDPVLAPHRNRVGLFVLTVHLRENVRSAAQTAVLVAVAAGGGHVRGPAPAEKPWLPPTRDPFTSPTQYYTECKDLLSDDEDQYPTLAVSIIPELAEWPAGEPGLGRLNVPAFEHGLLATIWMSLEPDFALYEFYRARPDQLRPVEAVCVRLGRARMFSESDWHYHTLDELAEIDKLLPTIGQQLAALSPNGLSAEEGENLCRLFVHLMRYRIYTALKRKEDAAQELERAKACSEKLGRMKELPHLMAALVALEQGRFKEAAAECRRAAELAPDPKMQRELRTIADEIEKELPESSALKHVIPFVTKRLMTELGKSAIAPESSAWAHDLCAQVDAQLVDWEKKFPSLDDVKGKAGEMWDRVKKW